MYIFEVVKKMEVELIHFLANHYNSDSVRSKLDILLVFAESTNAKLGRSHLQMCLLEQCNHNETDTRVVRRVSLSGRLLLWLLLILIYSFCFYMLSARLVLLRNHI